MESFLIKQDLSLALEGKSKKPTSMKDEDWEILDKKVRATMFLLLSNNVTTEMTAKVVWDKLTTMYAMASTANKVFIMKKLYKLKMKEGGIMANHINEFNTLINQANSVGMTQDDENKAVLLLCSLPSSWDGVVTVVSTLVFDKNKLFFDDVAVTILSEGMRRKNQESSSGEALTVVSIDNR